MILEILGQQEDRVFKGLKDRKGLSVLKVQPDQQVLRGQQVLKGLKELKGQQVPQVPKVCQL